MEVQDFGIRGSNYIVQEVSVVSLACDMTGPPLHLYQILSYLKQYVSYGLHKISASGEITT